MPFLPLVFTVGQKLTSGQLNSLTGNFSAIVEGTETLAHNSTQPYFKGRAVKTAYFAADGVADTVFGDGLSSVTYDSLGTYQVNWSIPYTTETYCTAFQGEKVGTVEGRNFQFACQSKSTSSITIYYRASDSGDTDPVNANRAVVMAWATNGI